MVVIDDKVIFDPFKQITGFASEDSKGKLVLGTVVMVNYEHKWFAVEYECGGEKQRTSFKFSQIGKDVLVCGEC